MLPEIPKHLVIGTQQYDKNLSYELELTICVF